MTGPRRESTAVVPAGIGPRERDARRRRPSLRTVLLVVAALIAVGWPIQEAGWSQKAHYALVQSLADGTPRIDAYHRVTGDKAYVDGHFYSVKAPGLAFTALPAYLVLDAFDAVPEDTSVAVWLLNLFSVVPFALLLVVLLPRASVEVTGGAAAPPFVLAATLVLPFATLFYAHVPTAALALLSVYLALVAHRTGRIATALSAGVAGGLAVVYEYPTAVVVAAVVLFLAWPRGRRGLETVAAYCLAAAATGLVPILAYNQWAFGSPTHVSYGQLVAPEDWQSDAPSLIPQSAFGFSRPSLEGLADLLLSQRGTIVTTPIVLAGILGLGLLYRRGRRRETLLLGGTMLVALVWNTGYTDAYGGVFGGDTPGPRYLVVIMPLALLGLGLVHRRTPGPAVVAWIVSLAFMTLVTATRPQVGSGETGQWWSRLTDGDFTRTPFSLLGLGSGWISILPFLAAILLGSATAGRAWLVPRSPRVVVEAATAFICWLVVAVCGPAILSQSPGTGGAILALVMLAAALCAIAIGVYRLPVVADDVVAASAGRARRQTEAPSAGATALLAPPATRVGEASGVALDEPGTQVAGVTAAEREAAVPELSAVVLCYRAGEALVSVVEPLHEQLVASGTPFELVLVANYWEGSDDETPAVARAFAEGHARVRVVAKPKEGRMGWDMLSGLDAARGAFLVVIDGDAQNPVEDVLRLHGVMAATGAPVAKGRRIRRGDGAYRSAVSAFYNALFLLLFRTSGIWDINGKPKGLTREAYERIRPELQSTDWFTDAEIVLTAHRLGLPIAEMPVRFLPSTRPSLVGPGTIVEFVVNILRYRFGSRQRR